MRQKSERASLQQRLDEKQYSASLASHRLTPEDLRMRNGEGLKETEISVPPGVSVVVLELPVSGKPTSYRASLKTFVANQEIVSESALRPELRNGNMVVALSVPSSLMEDRKHYVVVLYAANGAGRLEKVRFFTFHVVKP